MSENEREREKERMNEIGRNREANRILSAQESATHVSRAFTRVFGINVRTGKEKRRKRKTIEKERRKTYENCLASEST